MKSNFKRNLHAGWEAVIFMLVNWLKIIFPRCFPGKVAKFFRSIYLENTSKQLLLQNVKMVGLDFFKPEM